MYCNKCGKHNSEDSKFCKSCGAKIIRASAEHKVEVKEPIEDTSSEVENKKPPHDSDKVNTGLGGWLALVGLGLIIIPFMQAYSLWEYIPLLDQTYEIPGYLTLLWIEFVANFVILIICIYLLYLYFKKDYKFPKYYFIFFIAFIVYAIIDHILLASLTAPTQEQQQVINDVLSENFTELFRGIVVNTIWAIYIKKSKRVKATFVHGR